MRRYCSRSCLSPVVFGASLANARSPRSDRRDRTRRSQRQQRRERGRRKQRSQRQQRRERSSRCNRSERSNGSHRDGRRAENLHPPGETKFVPVLNEKVGQKVKVVAKCGPTESAVGGGGEVTKSGNGLNESGSGIAIGVSRPSGAGPGNEWIVESTRTNTQSFEGDSGNVTAFVICAK